MLQVAYAQRLQSPEDFLGFKVGTDKKLARWDKIVEYCNLAAEKSDRVMVQELGKSTLGNPFILVTISSPKNLKNLNHYKTIQRKLADPRGLSDEELERLAQEGKTVVLITCSIHASEIGATQMSLELIYRLATEQSRYIQNILDNVIFLLVPSFNPDGQIMVVDWYNKNLDTEYENSPMPWLYHYYTGHDNNRDAFMLTQKESQYVTRILYKEWFPEVYLDEHQMGPTGARTFVPPFKNPINPNVNPLIWEEIGMLGFSMNAALNEKGYTGVIYDAMFTSWWQGAFLQEAWWHNTVGLLTELASVRIATPIEQDSAKLGIPPPAQPREFKYEDYEDPTKKLPAPTDTEARNNYPRPWLGGKWTLRNIVDYELAATFGLLSACADNRVMFLNNFWRMAKQAVEDGKTKEPFAFLVPPDQQDPIVAAKMLDILQQGGVEVHRAEEPFKADGKEYPAGTYVVLMSQPYRAYAKDMLEVQKYVAYRPTPTSQPESPYDVTGWTLPLQMGVKCVQVNKRFDVKLIVAKAITPPEPMYKLQNPKYGYVIGHETNNSLVAVNRFLREGYDVYWAKESFYPGDGTALGGTRFSPGAIVVRGNNLTPEKITSITKDLFLNITALDSNVSIPALRLRKPRLAVYQPWTANMDEGWTRWLLEQYEFPFTILHNADIKAGKLEEKFDVLILPEMGTKQIMEGTESKRARPEYKGGVGEEGMKAIKEFVQEGGTLITIGNSANFVIDKYAIPFKNALKGLGSEKFSCPGSILRVFLDNRHPVAYGMPEEASAYFVYSPAFDLSPSFATMSPVVIGKYPNANLLQSGWIQGEENLFDKVAIAEVKMGRGKIILLGFRVQHRAQPHGTFKLLFNAIFYGATEETMLK